MLAITVRSCLEELKAVNGGGEIIIVDNSDEDIWQVIKTPNVSPLPLIYVREGVIKLVRQPFPSLYSARATGHNMAQGEYTTSLDSHVLLGRDSLKDLVDFMDSASDKVGLAYAPIGWMDKHEKVARHEIRQDQGRIFATWGRQYHRPTKICWNFSSFIARTEWFNNTLNGYSFYATEHAPWGGGEFYVAIKSWLLGYENWAVPTSPRYHIGPYSKKLERTTGYRYRLYGTSGEGKNYLGILAAFYALGGDDAKAEAKKSQKGFAHQYGLDVDKDWPVAKKIAEADRKWIEERQIMSFQEFLKKRPWTTSDIEKWTPCRELSKRPLHIMEVA